MYLLTSHLLSKALCVFTVLAILPVLPLKMIAIVLQETNNFGIAGILAWLPDWVAKKLDRVRDIRWSIIYDRYCACMRVPMDFLKAVANCPDPNEAGKMIDRMYPQMAGYALYKQAFLYNFFDIDEFRASPSELYNAFAYNEYLLTELHKKAEMFGADNVITALPY